VPPVLQEETELQTDWPLIEHDAAVCGAQLHVSVDASGGTTDAGEALSVHAVVIKTVVVVLLPSESVHVTG